MFPNITFSASFILRLALFTTHWINSCDTVVNQKHVKMMAYFKILKNELKNMSIFKILKNFVPLIYKYVSYGKE